MHDATCGATPQLNQPQRGYRFSADAVALAEFAQASATDTVLDLCSGCGVVPILMWQRFPFRYGVGVELDAELATLACRNVTQFHLEGKIHIVQGDIRFLSPNDLQVIAPAVSSGRFEVITANPPYWPLDEGRLNPNLQKAAARHEVFLTLDEVLAAARRFLKPGGRLYLSHLESRKSEILANLEQRDLVIRRTPSVSGLSGRLLFEAHLNEKTSGPNLKFSRR
jgi:tRNA1Val (adenine37-N6)-methyltransferase